MASHAQRKAKTPCCEHRRFFRFFFFRNTKKTMLQDFVAVSGRRFSRVRVAHWQGPMVEGSGAVIAAGTHSDPANTVSVWNASVAGDARHADRLLDHEEEIFDRYARPPLSYRVDGDVAALEFWGAGYGREDGSMRLWAGTSTGSVSLLSAQRYEHETDAEGRRLETWQVLLCGPCPSALASAAAGDTRVISQNRPLARNPKRTAALRNACAHAGVASGHGGAHRQNAPPLTGRLSSCCPAIWQRRVVSRGGWQGLVTRVPWRCSGAHTGRPRGLCCGV